MAPQGGLEDTLNGGRIAPVNLGFQVHTEVTEPIIFKTVLIE